jgi:flagella basal body P-ring formation protein FlgA
MFKFHAVRQQNVTSSYESPIPLTKKNTATGIFTNRVCQSFRCCVVLAAVFVGMPAAVTAGEPIRVNLQHEVASSVNKVVRLGDVATIETSSPQLASKLAALDLDTFTRGDSAVLVSREQVRIRLALAGLNHSDLVLTGVSEVKVTKVEAASVLSELESALHQNLAHRYQIIHEDLSVKLDSSSAEIGNRPLLPGSLRIVQNMPAELPLGQKHIAVQLSDTSGQTHETRLNVRIALFRELVVASKPIRKGDVMNADNVESVRRAIDSRRVRFASLEQVVGRTSRADIGQYDLIKSSGVQTTVRKTEHAIRKNALINVIVRRGPLEVTLKGARAIDSGNPGDQIALLNPHTREQIVARVIDGSTAEVRY